MVLFHVLFNDNGKVDQIQYVISPINDLELLKSFKVNAPNCYLRSDKSKFLRKLIEVYNSIVIQLKENCKSKIQCYNLGYKADLKFNTIRFYYLINQLKVFKTVPDLYCLDLTTYFK